MGILAERMKALEAQAAAGSSVPPSQPSGSAAPPPAARATPSPLPPPAQPTAPASGAGPSALPAWDPKYRAGSAIGEIMAQRRAASAAAAEPSQPLPSSVPDEAARATQMATIMAMAATKTGRPAPRAAAAAPPAVPAAPRRGGAAAAGGRKARPSPGAMAYAADAKEKAAAAKKKGPKRVKRGVSVSKDEDDSEEDYSSSSDSEDEESSEEEVEEEEEAGPSSRKRKVRPRGAAPAAAPSSAPAQLPPLWDLVAESEAEAAAEAERVAAAAAVAAHDPLEFRVSLDDKGADCPPGAESYLDMAVPGPIAQYLRPYQRAGIRFLLGAYAAGRGVLLADDMGLGKTLQSVAFLAAVLGKTGGRGADRRVPRLSRLDPIAPAPAGPGAGSHIAATESYDPDYTAPFPALVVAPATLLDNWAAELAKWGTFRHHKFVTRRVAEGVAAALGGAVEVALVSYSTLGTHSDAIASVPWHVVIFDEAHELKNPKTAKAMAADRLPTPLRFGLTGTPMPNDHKELFHLLNLLNPGLLGTSKDFSTRYAMPIKKGQKAGATLDAIADGAAAQAELRKALRPLMLRRTKAIIASQLPTKRDHVVLCRLAPVQLRVYQRLLRLPDVTELLLKANEPCPCGSGESRVKCSAPDCEGFWRLSYDQGAVIYPHFHDCDCDNAWDPVQNPSGCRNHRPHGCLRVSMRGPKRICPYCIIMPLITLLRKAALHLDLLKARPADAEANPRRYEWDKEVAAAAFGSDDDDLGGVVQSDRYVDLANVSSCGKLTALKMLLGRWTADAKGDRGRPHKVLIFSTSVRMLKIVEAMAGSKGWSSVTLTGATPADERQTLVNTFNADSTFLLLASTQVGGVGLNLTGANKVVILDPSYNPAQDLQSMDRAFRIGQSRDVAVYRLVAAGTIEETIYLRQVSKQQHAAIAVEGGRDLRRMFTGVKGHEQGELWGFQALLGPMLAAEAQRVSALDIMDHGDDRRDSGGELDVLDLPEEVAAAAAAAAAAGGGGGGRAATAGEVEDGFDAGVAALLGADDDGAFGAEVMDLPGVAGVVRHDEALAPSQRAAAQRSAAVAARERRAAVARGGGLGNFLECLAAWRGEAPAAMAARLLGMSAEERGELRRQYAEAGPRGRLQA